MLHDVRFALRALRRRPAFALVIVGTLALGIGANTAIFSVVNGIFLKPVPGVQRPERLVEISRDVDGQFFDVSYPLFTDLRRSNDVLVDLAAVAFTPVALGGEEEPAVVGGLNVTGNYFALLGTRPALGRFFREEESFFPRAGMVVVIGHDLWQRRYGGAVDILGRSLLVNGVPLEVIGVAEPGFGGHAAALRADLWLPVGVPVPGLRSAEELRDGDSAVLEMIGRLREGISADSAGAALSALADGWQRAERPQDAASPFRIQVLPFSPVPGIIRGGVTVFFAVLLAIVGLVLAIACVNVAGVMLSRGTERAREIAIRLSMGATRGQLVRQLLTEALVLSIAAAFVGLLLATWATRLLATLRPPIPLPGIELRLNLAPDFRVLSYSVVLAGLTTVLFGLVPALRATRPDLVPALREDAVSARPRKQRLRAVLTAGQMAATMLLLIGAGLFLRTLSSRHLVDPGFEAQGVDTIGFNLELSGFDEGRGREFYSALLERARDLPGVTSAALAHKLPLGGRSSFGWVTADGVEPPPQGGFDASHNVVSSAYFRTLHIPILEGRDFRDREDGPVVVINEALARRVWPRGDAVGRRLQYGGVEREVIGVAATVKYGSLSEPPVGFLYLPAGGRYDAEMTLHLRRAARTGSPIPRIREVVRDLDASVPVLAAMPLPEALQVFFLPQRLAAWITSVVGLVGLGMAALGIYGATAFAAAQRRREVGVRLALGATPGDIAAMMVRRGMLAPTLGMAAGLAAAAGLTRFLQMLLVGVSPLDPVTFAAVAALLSAVALVANLLPARRSSRLDPMAVLRSE